MRQSSSRKDLGSYYTPADVVRTLVTWAMEGDLSGGVLDPSCGDGRFLRGLKDAVGVDVDPVASAAAAERVEARIVTADFFAWASETNHRFAATVGNPPFIRYQRFNGALRQRALEYCAAQGVTLSGLCSSWAPFVVAASSVLKPGGRLAFVVPAEIRRPWFAVPDVRTPHAFLSIMSGHGPRLVANSAGVTCTNSVHGVHFLNESDVIRYINNWRNELTTFSCELEGHALGGGLLKKIEPAEARRVLLAPGLELSEEEKELLRSGTRELRRRRHFRAA